MALAKRLIPCLDIRAGRVVKGVNFINLRDAGNPAEVAKRYSDSGADELVFLDITASVENRGTLLATVEEVARQIAIPLTVGGGVKSARDMEQLLLSGADKVSFNTAAVAQPNILKDSATHFGSQCVVLAIDAKKTADGWCVWTHGGRRATDKDVLEWIKEGQALGAGEILLTSMDSDGTQGGYDIPLLQAAHGCATVPIIASGGAGQPADVLAALQSGRADAALAASIFHDQIHSINEIKLYLQQHGIEVRLDNLT